MEIILPARRLRRLPIMKRRRIPLPFMVFELALASWETIARRIDMMALGTCSPAEYQRMATEKIRAAQRSALASVRPSRDPQAAMLAPWHRAASANAKRLRRKKRP